MEEADSRITLMIQAIMTPEVSRIDGELANVVSSLKEVSAQSGGYENKVMAAVEGMFRSFKTEMMGSFARVNKQVPSQTHQHTAGGEGFEDVPLTGKTNSVARDGNDDIIDNVMANISHYSTPPDDEHDNYTLSQQSVNPLQGPQQETNNGNIPIDPLQDSVSKSQSDRPSSPANGNEAGNNNGTDILNPHPMEPEDTNIVMSNMRNNGRGGDSVEDQSARSGHSQTHDDEEPLVPSFSLGLTQEEAAQHEDDDQMGDNKHQLGDQASGEGSGDAYERTKCRKSKRIKAVPAALITNYQCDTSIRNRAREGTTFGNGSGYELSEIQEKYNSLKVLVKKDCVINVSGLSVTAKDIMDIGERQRFLPGRVIDILMRVVSISVSGACSGSSHPPFVFLDSRLQVVLSRNFVKFKRMKYGGKYSFTKALVDIVTKSSNFNNAASRFYLPLSIGRQHWIGICVDIAGGKIYILDCNPELTNANALSKEIAPLAEMFPSLVEHCRCLPKKPDTPYVIESLKGLVPNTNSVDSAMTALLLMQSHALYGVDSCSAITPSLIPLEAQRAAVMMYEIHKKL
ncbi:Uncharacterized protein Rs2_38438 [Raphanus sativus]|nr:Uncharacterized protein Rs2_38438 [Raphanus sativus]